MEQRRREEYPTTSIEDWRERLEEGIRRQPVVERTALLERLLTAHESHEQFLQAAIAQAERRMKEVRVGPMKLIPAEVVLQELDRMTEEAEKNGSPPPAPEDVKDIEEQALHLINDDFCALLVNAEAELPPDIDPTWRADIRARIQAVPAEIERRYREQEENGGDPEGSAILDRPEDSL